MEKGALLENCDRVKVVDSSIGPFVSQVLGCCVVQDYLCTS